MTGFLWGVEEETETYQTSNGSKKVSMVWKYLDKEEDDDKKFISLDRQHGSYHIAFSDLEDFLESNQFELIRRHHELYGPGTVKLKLNSSLFWALVDVWSEQGEPISTSGYSPKELKDTHQKS